MNKTIIVVARQAGTANAFLPLFEGFRKANFSVKTFAFAQAHKLFSANGIDAALIEHFDDSLFGDIRRPSFMLTGTSEYAHEDNHFWQWAKGNGIPSLAFVDSWVSYWQRFTCDDIVERRFNCTPDMIAVIDQFMYDRMVENGCNKELLIITGSPAFDSLLRYVSKEKKNIVDEYGEDYILFIGEPFNPRVYGGSEKDALGYTEAEVLTLIADALDMLERQRFKLVFRPHPRGGHSGEVTSVIDSHSSIVVDPGGFTSRDLAACARAVVGMTSMLLFEASMMGVPAISVRPNRKLFSDVIDGCSKIPIVTSSQPDEVHNEMKRILSAEPASPYIAKSTLWDVIRQAVSKQ